MPLGLVRHKPGLFFVTKSSNKAVVAAILLDMHNTATPLVFRFISSFSSQHFKRMF